MKKILLPWLVATMLLLSMAAMCPVVYVPVTPATSVQANVYSMAKVSCVTVMTDTGSGSGFCVGEELIAIAKHVVEDAKWVLIITASGRTFPVYEVTQSEKTDLALLKYFGDVLPVLNLSGGVPSVGDNVFVIGSPLGVKEFRLYLTTGIVGSVDGLIFVTADVNPGNSGGPLFNERGEVVGVVVAKLFRTTILGFVCRLCFSNKN